MKVGKVVDEHFVLKCHDDAVPAQSNGVHLAAEAELADAATLVVVPYHELW